MEKKSPCCSKGPSRAAAKGLKSCQPQAPVIVTSKLTVKDRIGAIKCRFGIARMDYRVPAGLYSIGAPKAASEVFVSANYKLSFDILRASLKGIDAWILVLDTGGVNVWCAAGKGTFGTAELVSRIKASGLEGLVSHRRVIVPQLGAPGISAHIVKKEAGFRVSYGPVRARDIKAYLAAGLKASPSMRLVEFTLTDRLKLIPMELIPALKVYAVYALLMLFVSGISRDGISFAAAYQNARIWLSLGLASILAGALLTPVLLPYLPARSFAVKGLVAGAATTIALLFASSARPGALGILAAVVFFPLASSYAALQFTGASVYTGVSGVEKEIRYALPVYKVFAALSIFLFLIYKLGQWGKI